MDPRAMRVCLEDAASSDAFRRSEAEDADSRRSRHLVLLRQILQSKREPEVNDKHPSVFVIDTGDPADVGGVGKPRGGKRWPQYLAAVLATLVSTCAGSAMGWSAPALPMLEARLNGTASQLTEVQTSWISSLLPLGALVAVLPAGKLADAVGRRSALLWMAPAFLVGWLLVAVDVSQIPLIYAGRFVCGLCLGATSVIVPLYVEEIAEVSIRGLLGVLYDLTISAGILWGYVAGALLSYEWLAFSCAALAIAFAAGFWWMPESPVHLVSSGHRDDAEASFRWLRRGGDFLPELRQLEKVAGRLPGDDGGGGEGGRSSARKAVWISAGLMMFRQLSGVNAVLFYAVDVFSAVGSGGDGALSPTSSAVVVGAAQLAATMASGLLVESAGRRPLLAASGAVSAACHAALAGYFHLRASGAAAAHDLGWLPLAALVVFIFAFNLGFGPLPWLVAAELVPVGARAWASPLAVSVNWLLTFVVTLCFAPLEAVVGPAAVFAGFGVACAASFAFVLLYVPETRGKTREDIHKMLVAGE